MVVILAIDGLEYEKVEGCRYENLRQKYCGKTDISQFSEPRTMVLWSSFITGKNKEKEVLEDGNKEMWNKKWDIDETFFSAFDNPAVIDLPGFSYDTETHERSRELLKQFFGTEETYKKEKIRKEYNRQALEHHKEVKEKFLKATSDGRNDIVLGYFSAIDAIGHLNFSNKFLIKMLYGEMEELAGGIRDIPSVRLLILSDHGMKALGDFGEHTHYGFWSANFADLGTPKITDFYDLLMELK